MRDVRSFTTLSEGLTAEELIRFLNELFTPLSEVILAERGTIDKFMGDAVMAFWNAPLADPRHASNACRAALRMHHELDRLNVAWAQAAAQRGATAVPVRIGIGLNTGECCVGNVGSPQRFDYSILGDVVNLASRLEETTKTYGCPIVVGERTAAAAPELAFLEIDAAKIRGKERTERIFALVGDEAVAARGRFRALPGPTPSQQACAPATLAAAGRHEGVLGRGRGRRSRRLYEAAAVPSPPGGDEPPAPEPPPPPHARPPPTPSMMSRPFAATLPSLASRRGGDSARPYARSTCWSNERPIVVVLIGLLVALPFLPPSSSLRPCHPYRRRRSPSGASSPRTCRARSGRA